MIEIFIVLALVFLVAVFFYKQALEEFDVLQIEANQLDQLPKLLSEQSFLVIRSLPKVQFWSAETVKEIPRIHKAPYGTRTLLEIAEKCEGPLPDTYPQISEHLAEQTGLKTWIQTTWLPKIVESDFVRWMFSVRVESCIGNKGLRKTTAYSTMILPTSGNLIVSVMPESSMTYLPKQWQGKFFPSLKRAEAPLLGEIKFLDIKVREGSALLVPPHWIVNIEKDGEVPWFIWTEFHHPLSKLAQMMND
jgi:hypothetical protein